MQTSRSDKVSLVLLALCLITAATAWVIGPPTFDRHDATAGKVDLSGADGPLSSGEIPGTQDDGPEATLDDYAEIVERPLFDPTRRPPDELAELGIDLDDAPDTMAGRSGFGSGARSGRFGNESLKLVGIVIDHEKRFALVKNTGLKATQRIEVGGDVDGWRLSALTAASATLNRGGQSKTLELERKGDPKLAARAKALAKRRMDQAKLKEKLRKTAAANAGRSGDPDEIEKDEIEEEEEEEDDELAEEEFDDDER